MAEKLKELFRGKIDVRDFFSGRKAQLFATTAAQSAVIKSMQLDFGGDAPFSVDLLANDYRVGSYAASCEGTEIVGANTAVELRRTEPITKAIDLQIDICSGTYSKLDLKLLGDFTAREEVSYDVSSTPYNNLTYGVALLDDADAYLTIGVWDGNSSTKIYKYDRSSLSLLKQITPANNYVGPPIYGGDGYLYWMDAGVLKRMRVDDDSDAETFCTGLSNTPSFTYPLFGTNSEPAPNGDRMLVTWPAYNSGSPTAHLIDSSGAVKSSIRIGSLGAGFWSNNGGEGAVHPFWSAKENRWNVLYRRYGQADLRLAAIPTSNTTSLTDFTEIKVSLGQYWEICVSDGRIFAVSYSTGVIKEYGLGLEDLGVVAKVSDLTAITRYQQPVLSVSTPDLATIDSRDYPGLPSVDVRITGVLME